MGRRRSLDINNALPLIVRLFWRHGYDGLTLEQVAMELDVTKPTLYRAFGDKEDIFVRALEAYHLEFIKPGEDRLEKAPDLRSAVTACFSVAADRMLNDQNPTGCFLTDVGLSGNFPAGVVADTLIRLQQRAIALLREKIAAAIEGGELNRAASPDAVLQYVLAQLAALSALSHNNTNELTLRSIIHFMIEGLPWARGDNAEPSH